MNSLNTLKIGTLGFLGLTLFASPLLAAETAANDGSVEFQLPSNQVRFEPNGSFQVLSSDGKSTAAFSIDYFRPGWGLRSQSRLSPTDVTAVKGKDNWQWSGVFEEDGAKLQWEQQVTRKEDTIEIVYRLECDPEFAFQEGSRGPFLLANLPQEFFKGTNIMLGKKTLTLPLSNAWGNGNQLVLPQIGVELSLKEWVVMSLWASPSANSVRLQMAARGKTDSGRTLYLLSVTVGGQKIKVSKKIMEEPIVGKFSAYARVLEMPTVTGIETTWPLAQLKEAEAIYNEKDKAGANQKVEGIEDWLDAGSRLNDLNDRVVHVGLFEQVMGGEAHTGLQATLLNAVKALNTGDVAAAIAQADSLRSSLAETESQFKKQHGIDSYPGSGYNPDSWVKAFTTVGYVGESDEMTPGEPTPARVGWHIEAAGGQDFFLSLLGDNAPTLADFEVERTWVRNTWKAPDGPRYTFSVLTPLIAVDGVDSLPMRGLPGKPEQLSWVDASGALTSVVFDENETQKLPVNAPAGGWLWVRGARFAILFFPTVPVSEVSRVKDGLEIHLTKPGSISLMVIPEKWREAEERSEAGFWTGVAVNAPEDVVEVLSDGAVTHRYLYHARPNAWKTEAKVIAPVPVLTVMRGLGEWKHSTVPTTAGTFAYADGDRVRVELPVNKRPVLRGINEYLLRLDEKRVAELSADHVGWVRIVIGPTGWSGTDEVVTKLDEVLARLTQHKIKALIDPHDFAFAVNDYDKGIPTDKAARAPFLQLWKDLATVGVRYPETVVGYDLYNELRVRRPFWDSWSKLAHEAIDVIRPIDPKTPIYISGVDMSNPSGYINAKPVPGDDNLVYSFHFYAPHAFSHQKIFTASTSDAFVFYPGWVPQIDWGKKEIYGKGSLQWWDHWTLQASMWPVLQFAALNHASLHCGEVAPIGYSAPKAAEGAGFWNRDSIDTLEQYGISWHLWNQGFGMAIDQVAADVRPRWAGEEAVPKKP